MKLIICGGRNYRFTKEDFAKLDQIHRDFVVTEVVSGGATGADFWGQVWARMNSIPLIIFEADWVKYGKPAGPMRNEQMAQYADAVVAFPGGRGTANMLKLAKNYKLLILNEELQIK